MDGLTKDGWARHYEPIGGPESRNSWTKFIGEYDEHYGVKR